MALATVLSTVVVAGLTVSQLITAASMAYQILQAKKMKKMARDAAEARKGFELVSEGEVYPIPIVYGRAKIGGVRAYTNTSHNFYYTTPNSDLQFLKSRSAFIKEEDRYDNTNEETYRIPVEYPSSDLNETITGTKNEFLFIEQALCQGPINRVIDVAFDDSIYLDDPGFSAHKENREAKNNNQSGVRIDVHYGDDETPEADAIIVRNFPQRDKAYFTNLAHATITIRQFRDDPLFRQIPMVQFFIEGRKVRTISNGALSTERTYSNNPAYCLLDYLLSDPNYKTGKNLSPEDIDLSSFEQAAQICNTVVAQNKPLGGKIWYNTEGTFQQKYRDIPLYECNIVIDTSKKVRENIEAILSTMGDARLVWSQGKYKLLLQYPESNSEIDIATTITDDDIVQGDTVEINWPDSSQRLNYCTVRFHNEAENFKEDSVSWPPKTSGASSRGFNGIYYEESSPSSQWGGTYADLLNNYAVWDLRNLDGDNNDDTIQGSMTWKFSPLSSEIYTISWAVDDTGTFEILEGETVLYSFVKSQASNSKEEPTISLTQGTVYSIRFSNLSNSGGGRRGAAFTVKTSDGAIVFSSRSIAYEDYITTNQSNAIYLTLLEEDNNVELENDIFLEGCTDYYHALAKAEELVRTSRSSFGIKFKYVIKDNFLEPGDIILLNSKVLNFEGSNSIYVRVNEVRIEDGSLCEVTGTRFDYTQLAWNVEDDQYVVPINAYNNFTVPGPSYLSYIADGESVIYGSSGVLNWDSVESNLVVGYILYIHRQGNVDSVGRLLFDEIGRVGSDVNTFNLPAIGVANAIFGIRAYTATNVLSAMTTTNTTAFESIVNPLTRSVEITTNNIAFVWQANNAGWNVPSITLNTEVTGYTNPFYQWYIDDVFLEGETGSSIVVLPFDDFRTRRYKVEVGETGNFSATQTEDFITLLSVQEGSDAYIINLTNESVQIETGSDGSVPSGTFPLTIGTGVARGSTIVTTGYGIVYSLEEPEGIVATIDSTTGVITVTAITGLSNTITVVAEVTPGVFLRKLLYVSKLVPGVSPPLLSLKTTSPGFLFENATATTTSTPDSITLTAVFENITGQAAFVAEAFDIANVSLGNLTLPAATHTPSNSTVVISDDLFASIANVAYVRVTATLNSLSDTVTLYRLNDGENALNLYMHNENHSVPATSDGTVTDLDEAFTYIFVFQGINNVTNDWTFTKSDIGMNTLLTQDSSDPPRMLLQVQSVTNTIATTTVTATRAGYPTLEKVFTITKSIAGQDGIDGEPGAPGPPGASVPGPRSANGYIYYKFSTSSDPGQPSTGTYNFSNGTFSSLNSNWTLDFTAPSSSDGQYWAVRFSVAETTYGGSQSIQLSSAFKWQNLNGLITFSNIQTGFDAGVTTIDGGKITANTLAIDRIQSGTRNFTNGKFALGTGAQVANTFNTTIGAEVNSGSQNANRIPIISWNACAADYGHGLAAACTNPNSFGLLALNLATDITVGGGRSVALLAGEYRGGIFRRLHNNRDTVEASSVYDRETNVRTEAIICDNNYSYYGIYSPSYGSGVAYSSVYLNYSTTAAFFYSYPQTSQFVAASMTYGAYAIHAAGTNPSVFLAYNNTSAGRQSGIEAYTTDTNARLATRDGGISYSGYFNNNVKIAANVFPFTGSHEGEIIETPEIGDIVVDVEIVERKDISNVYLLEKLSTKPKEKGVVGVVSFIKQKEEMYTDPNEFIDVDLTDNNVLDSQPVEFGEPQPSLSQKENTPTNIQSEEYTRLTDGRLFIYFNAVGEGQVNVCGENGNIEIGDLIVTSSIPGKGMKQDDDIVRSYTVAKSRENVTFDSPDQVKMIACIYLCG